MFHADILQSRLDFAKQLGADYTMLVSREDSEATLVARIHELLGEHPDRTFDCSGAQATVRLALMVSDLRFLLAILLSGCRY